MLNTNTQNNDTRKKTTTTPPPSKKHTSNFTFRDGTDKPQAVTREEQRPQRRASITLQSLMVGHGRKSPIASKDSSVGSLSTDEGLSMKSEDAGGDFLVDFPMSREEFLERREAEATTLPDGTPQRRESQTFDEADQRRPWRRNVKASAMHVPEYLNDSSLSFAYLEMESQLIASDLNQPHESGTELFVAADLPDKDTGDQEYGHLHAGDGFANNGREDESSVLSELLLAQTALGWNEDDLKSHHSSSTRRPVDTGKGVRSREPRFRKEFERRGSAREKNSSDDEGNGIGEHELPMTEFMANLRAKAAKRVTAIRARQQGGTSQGRKRIGNKLTVLEGTKESMPSDPTPLKMKRSKSLNVENRSNLKGKPLVDITDSESNVKRVPDRDEHTETQLVGHGESIAVPLNNDVEPMNDGSSQPIESREVEALRERRKHHHRRHRRRRHRTGENGERHGREKDVDENGELRHRSKSRRRRHRSKSQHRGDGDEREAGDAERRSRSHKSRRRRSVRDGEAGIDGEEPLHVSGTRSRRRLDEEDIDTEAKDFLIADEETNTRTPEESEAAAKAAAMFGFGNRVHSSIVSNERLSSVAADDQDTDFDDDVLPTVALGEDSDSDIEAKGSQSDTQETNPVPGTQNLSNFHSVFTQGRQKKPETFHGVWADVGVLSGSEEGSHASNVSRRTNRISQVKVTLRARGFGLKMQRICGPRIWAKKWYILGGVVLLVLILAISIPLASQRGNPAPAPIPPDNPADSPSASPTGILSYQILTELSGEQANDFAGTSVALSADGQFLAVGLPQTGSGSGEVLVFALQDGELLPYGDPIIGVEDGDMFGSSISISDDGQTLVVGSPTGNADLGYAVVFLFDTVTSAWVQLGETITSSEPGGFSGSSVAISGNGNRVAVGAPRVNSNDGVTLVFQYNPSTEVWTRLGQRIVGVGSELNGYSLSLDTIGDTIAIGAVRSESSQDRRGRVYVYALKGSQWSILGTSISGSDLLGRSVSLSSDGMRLAIGSTGFDADGMVDVGACEVYGYVGDWVQFGSTIVGEQDDERIGFSVSLSRNGQRLACGGPGSSVVRVYEEDRGDWRLIGQPLNGSSGTDFGAAVSLNSDGSFLAIGAPVASVGGEANVGAVQVRILED
ncbi:hypothetical protein MHU86_16767 [Fragilaria crotonensis]|nr:hypothetical protein MHU86_16767 [Fragilaria crotonensis]